MWGCMGLLVRTLNEQGLNSMEITALRCLVTSVCVAVLLLIFNRKAFVIRMKDIWCFIGTGIISVTFFNVCYFQTITLTSLSVAAILLYTAPTFVALMAAVLFGEKLTGRKGIALVLAFLGCVLVTGIGGQERNVVPLGILMGLGSGIGYALYSIFGRYAIRRGYGSMTITLYTFLFASAGTFPFVGYPKMVSCFEENGKLAWIAVGLIVWTTVAPYFVYTLGLKYMEAGKASVIASIEPVVATLVGVILYKEEMSATGLVGILLVLGSIALMNISGKKKRE